VLTFLYLKNYTKTYIMNNKQIIINNINRELRKIPVIYLANLYEIIHIFGEKITHVKPKIKSSEKEFLKLFGSWKSEYTGDELVKEIYKSRKDKPRDVEL